MTAPATTRLVIADDHPLFRDALRQAVASVVTTARIDEAGSFDDLTALLEQDSDVDLILLDLTMPGISGFSGLIYLRAQYPAIPVVVVSATDDIGTIRRSLDFGASGFIPKRFGVETLRDAITKVMDGDVWIPPDTDLSSAADPDMARLRDRLVTLTPQQVRVLMMLSEGLLNKQIAYELGVSEATIKAHVSAILQKLGVESRTQAVIAAAKIAGGQWRAGHADGVKFSLLLRRHHLLRAPLPEHGAQRGRLHRLVQHRNVLLARRGAHVRAAVGGDQDRRNVLAEAAADVADRGDAVAAVEVVVDQQSGDALCRGFHRRHRGFRVGRPQ